MKTKEVVDELMAVKRRLRNYLWIIDLMGFETRGITSWDKKRIGVFIAHRIKNAWAVGKYHYSCCGITEPFVMMLSGRRYNFSQFLLM